MTGNLLLTLGRLPKALDVARGFADLGWRVVVAEPFKRHLAGASRAVAQSHCVTAPAEDKQAYLADLRRIIVEEKIDLIVPVSEETMHVAFLRESLPVTTRLFAMPPNILLRLHNKHGFAQQAAAWGLAVPETYALGDPAAKALAQSGPVVMKPVHSCSGRGVRLLPAGAELPEPDAAVPILVNPPPTPPQARVTDEPVMLDDDPAPPVPPVLPVAIFPPVPPAPTVIEIVPEILSDELA
jgi:biotin carboxylase